MEVSQYATALTIGSESYVHKCILESDSILSMLFGATLFCDR